MDTCIHSISASSTLSASAPGFHSFVFQFFQFTLMLPLFSFQFDNFIIKSFLNFKFIALLSFNWTDGSCSFLFVSGRVYDGKESKWQCTDIEIQRHVIRSISSFLDCISGDTTHHPLVKVSNGNKNAWIKIAFSFLVIKGNGLVNLIILLAISFGLSRNLICEFWGFFYLINVMRIIITFVLFVLP